MDVLISYCNLCHLREPAERIAAALEKEFGLRCELRDGFWGTFQVVYRGEVIFNRWRDRGWLGRLGLGRTPTPDEIVERLRSRLATNSPAI